MILEDTQWEKRMNIFYGGHVIPEDNQWEQEMNNFWGGHVIPEDSQWEKQMNIFWVGGMIIYSDKNYFQDDKSVRVRHG